MGAVETMAPARKPLPRLDQAREQLPQYQQGEIPCPKDEQRYMMTREQVAMARTDGSYGNQWRRDSMLAVEYWDGNQFTQQLLQAYRRRGLPPIVHNVIKRWLNTVIGMQERNLSDGVFTVEDNRFEAYAKAMGQKLKDAEQLSKADRATLDAFASQMKAGIGWVEVGETKDPFAPCADVVENVPWREMDWDPCARKPDLSDARWKRRIRLFHREGAMIAFPRSRDIIKFAGAQGDTLNWYSCERMERSYDQWRDVSRYTEFGGRAEQIAISEFRYKVYVDGYVVDSPAGPIIFDEQNEDHLDAYYRGDVEPYACTFQRVRQAYWLGPHCLGDRWCRVPRNRDGWTPFICYIEEETGVPYGLIRDMISLQDEINATKAKAHWSMDSTTTIYEEGALVDADAWANEVNRRDAMLAVKNGFFGKVQLDRHPGLTEWNFKMYQDGMNRIGYVHGLDGAVIQSNDGSNSQQSGVAKQLDLDSSITCLGKPVNNYREARLEVLDCLRAQIERRMAQSGQPEKLRYKDHDGKSKTIQINVQVQLEDGSTVVMSPQAVRCVLKLSDVPSTPTYRAHQFRLIVETLQAMPPQAQLIMLPTLFELSDLPDREAAADLARKMLGLAGPQTPEEIKEAARKAQLQQIGEEALVRQEAAKAAQGEAQAAKTQAEAQAATTEAQNAPAKGDLELKQMVIDLQKSIQELRAMHEQSQANQQAARQQQEYSY